MSINYPDVLISSGKEHDDRNHKTDEQWLDFWQHHLKTLPPAPELPLTQNFNGLHDNLTQYNQQLDAATWLQLKEQGLQMGLSPREVLLTAYAEVLTTWSKNPHFTINLMGWGLSDINSNLESKQSIHQPKQNSNIPVTLLEIKHVQPNSFLTRAKHIQAQLKQDLKHFSAVQLQQLNKLSEGTLEKLNAILGISFFINTERKEDSTVGEDVIYSSTARATPRLEFRYLEKNGELRIYLNAVENLFPSDMVRDMLTSCCQLLQRLAQEEDAWNEKTRQMIPPVQLEQRTAINDTTAPLSEETLYSLFVSQVKQNPQHIAIKTPKKSITYDALYQRTSQIGDYLKSLNVRPNHLVAVVMEKGLEQIVAVLGILAAGAAYVPIDPELPPERVKYLLENSGVDILLTQSWLEEKLSWPPSIQGLAVDQEHLFRYNHCQLQPVSKPDDLAYVIFTSGSTGLPKGVMITHRNVVNVVIHTNQRFQVSSKDRILALTALNHDLSVYDIFGSLAAGATIVMPDATAAKFARHWLDLITREQVTLWNSVPAMMDMLVNYLEIKSEKLPSSLRLAILGGDWLPVSLVSRLKALSPNLTILSIGGPTETTIWNIGYLIKTIDPDWNSIPYGQPMANSKYYILNEDLEDCPVWVSGQMYCAGVQLAKGYWRNPEKTAANFITHPRTGERIYRTGDLGRYLPDGNIEFLGRVDFQIKLRGYRIEAGEIESALAKHPGVQNAVVTVTKTQQHQKYLTAYVVPQRGMSLNMEELRKFLEQKLPSYMVPSSFQCLETLPLTANGKVDRSALFFGVVAGKSHQIKKRGRSKMEI